MKLKKNVLNIARNTIEHIKREDYQEKQNIHNIIKIMNEKIPSLENSSKERLLFVCKNLQNLAKHYETKIAKLEMKVERLERENTELTSRDYLDVFGLK